MSLPCTRFQLFTVPHFIKICLTSVSVAFSEIFPTNTVTGGPSLCCIAWPMICGPSAPGRTTLGVYIYYRASVVKNTDTRNLADLVYGYAIFWPGDVPAYPGYGVIFRVF